MEILNELAHTGLREVGGIPGEILILVHVIDVSPHGLKRDAGLLVAGNNILELSKVLVAITALVPAKTPVGRHGRAADDAEVLLDDIAGSRAHEDVEVEDTTDHLEAEVVLAKLDIHGIAVAEEHTMSLARHTLVDVEGVRTIEVKINRGGGIECPHGEEVVIAVEAKGVLVLTKTVDVRVLRQAGGHREELILKDDTGSIEDHFLVSSADDLEAESLADGRDDEIIHRALCLSGRQIRAGGVLSRHLPALACGISELKVKTIILLVENAKENLLHIIAIQARSVTVGVQESSESVGSGVDSSNSVATAGRGLLAVEAPRGAIVARAPAASLGLTLILLDAEVTAVPAIAGIVADNRKCGAYEQSPEGHTSEPHSEDTKPDSPSVNR
eukprot:Colp12_sorted_trinity150504_noHs@21458